MQNPRYVNEFGGILIDDDFGGAIYVDNGELYEQLVAGDYGVVNPYVAPEPELPTPEQLCAALANKRWQIETGGYEWNGWPVDSDDRAQFKALAELLKIQGGTRVDGELWKFADGQFRSVTNVDFVSMYQAGEAHVKKSYAVEALCCARIAAGEYDIETMWAEEWEALNAG